MPFVSQAQEKWAFATHQPWARKWAKLTKKRLPQHVGMEHRLAKKMLHK